MVLPLLSLDKPNYNLFIRVVPVAVRFAPKEIQVIDFAARKLGLSRSAYIRMVSLREARLLLNSFKKGVIDE